MFPIGTVVETRLHLVAMKVPETTDIPRNLAKDSHIVRSEVEEFVRDAYGLRFVYHLLMW